MVAAIVLAAGLSKRMGAVDKLFLPWRNKTILETVVGALEKVNGVEIIVVAGDRIDQIKVLFPDPSVGVVYNARFKEGMTASIQAGVEAAKSGSAGFMICLADMPFIQSGEYQLLIDAFEETIKIDEQAVILPVFNHKKGNPVIFSAYYKDQILQHQESEGCKGIVQKAGAHVKLIHAHASHILMDIDVPEDYYAFLPSGKPAPE